MSPHTDPGALLKLADEIERACKAPNYEARLGTIEGKMVVAALRQAASQGSATAAQAPTNRQLHDAIASAVTHRTYSGIQDAVREIQKLYGSPVPSASRASPVMQAAEKAARVVDGWSDAKKEYAERTMVVGRVTGKIHEGDQVAGMPGAICHACGLKDYPCVNPDCPNRVSQVTSTTLGGARE